jgi:hypothetical protein
MFKTIGYIMAWLSWKMLPQSATTPSEAELKLKQLNDILFPPLELKTGHGFDGEEVVYHIDYGVDSNLDAALCDMQDGTNDEVTQRTIKSIIERLYKARELLSANYPIDKKAKFLAVADLPVDRI